MLRKASMTKLSQTLTRPLRSTQGMVRPITIGGIARFKKGETDRAISDFTKAIKMNPRFGMAYYYRGMTNLRKIEYDQVISDYTKAIEMNPRLAGAYYNRGNTYVRKSQYDLAISAPTITPL